MITYPPIKFECSIRGKELIAEVVAKEIDAGHFNFNTRFSDGFEDTFIHDDEVGIWKAVRDKEADYLERVKDDLSALLSYQVDRHYLTFRYKIGDELVNIWVFETQREDGYMVYSSSGCKTYVVYYKGDYRFEIKKTGCAWYAKTVRQVNPEIIDENLVATIGKMIDTRIKE
jgi:hypothetical protein